MVKLFFGLICLSTAYAQPIEYTLDFTYSFHEVILYKLYEFYFDNWIVITAIIGSLAFGFCIGKKHEKKTIPTNAMPTISQGTTMEVPE